MTLLPAAIDCQPNMVADEIKDRTVLDSFLIQGRMEWYRLKNRAELKAAFVGLQKNRREPFFFISGDQLFGDDSKHNTNGSPRTTWLFMRQAEIFTKHWNRFEKQKITNEKTDAPRNRNINRHDLHLEPWRADVFRTRPES
jgi:hypothetical protein